MILAKSLLVLFGVLSLSYASAEEAENAGDIDRIIFKPNYCKMITDLNTTVANHVDEWDKTVFDVTSGNCSSIMEFLYLSRATMQEELQYVFTNLTNQVVSSQNFDLITVSFLNFFSRTSALMSAHLHMSAAVINRRRECFDYFSRTILTSFLTKMKDVFTKEVAVAWHVYSGFDSLFQQEFYMWLRHAVEALKRETESLKFYLAEWKPPTREGQPGAPEDEPRNLADGTFTTIEAFRRTTFDEWIVDKGLLRFLLRHVLSKDETLVDFGAGGGDYATWLNDTGLVTAYAFDGTHNIDVVTSGRTQYLNFVEPTELWRKFDWSMSIEVAEHIPAVLTPSYIANLDHHANKGLIISWSNSEFGIGHINRKPLEEWITMIEATTSLRVDKDLTELARQSADITYIKDSITIFKRQTPKLAEEREPEKEKEEKGGAVKMGVGADGVGEEIEI